MNISKIYKNQKIIVAALFVCSFASIGAYLVFTSHALTQNTSKSSFDYGQQSGFTQPAGGEFEGTVIGTFNFNNSSPQQMVYQIGYDSIRVEALSVTCKTTWGCHKSQVNNDYFGGHQPSVLVCIDVPNGNYPGANALFTIQFKTRVALGASSNWWTSSSGVAPGTCTNNITAEGFMFNTIDGSGVCGGVFEACDRGQSPEIGSYIGFGPPGGSSTLPDNSKAQAPSTSSGPSGGGGSLAKKQGNSQNAVPIASAQGTETKQPEVDPSPFFDGREYEKGSNQDTQNGAFEIQSTRLLNIWGYAGLAIILGAFAGASIWYIRKR